MAQLHLTASKHGFESEQAMLAEWATMTPQEIKAKFGVSLATISAYGVFKRVSQKKEYPAETVELIRARLQAGVLVKDIAVELGISRQWVQEIMRRYGMSSRAMKASRNG